MKQFGCISRWLTLAVALGAFLTGETVEAREGRAVVRAIIGQADYADGSGSWKVLKVGKVLRQGAIVRTAPEAQVDLFLGRNGPVVRITQTTELAFDRLSFETTGVETVIDTGLDLKAGRILGKVDKMAEASRYEVETPNGVAGIRGTEYDISADGFVTVVEGEVVFVYSDPVDGTVTTHVINAGQTFNPQTKTVQTAPPNVIINVEGQIADSVNNSTRPPEGQVPPPQPPKDPNDTADDAIDPEPSKLQPYIPGANGNTTDNQE